MKVPLNLIIHTDLISEDCRTFQEGALSKRLLVFTEHQTSFYCQTGFWMEELADPDPGVSHQSESDHHYDGLFDDLVRLMSSVWSWERFAGILQSYNERQTTNEGDTLVAFGGVLNQVRRSHPTTNLLCGLPLCPTGEKVAGFQLIDSLEDSLSAALSWRYRDKTSGSLKRRSRFPSWTWAGWKDGAGMNWFYRALRFGHRSTLRHVHLESSSGRVVMPSALYQEHDLQQELDTVTLIQFEAPTISAASVSAEDILPSVPAQFWHHLIENEHKGMWSCLVLSAGRWGEGSLNDVTFVLVVCWEADQVTAERVGSFWLNARSSREAKLGLSEDSWTWRRVRLI